MHSGRRSAGRTHRIAGNGHRVRVIAGDDNQRALVGCPLAGQIDCLRKLDGFVEGAGRVAVVMPVIDASTCKTRFNAFVSASALKSFSVQLE